MNSAKAARTICGIGNLGHILINAILRLEPTSVFLNWSLNANDYVLWFLQAVRKNSATFLVYKIRFIYFQCKPETWYFIGRLPKRITRHARSIFNYSAKGHSFYPTCKYKLLTDSAVYRPKPGPNLVIRAGFLIFFFCTGWAVVYFCTATRPGFKRCKKIVTRVLTRLQPYCYSF